MTGISSPVKSAICILCACTAMPASSWPKTKLDCTTSRESGSPNGNLLFAMVVSSAVLAMVDGPCSVGIQFYAVEHQTMAGLPSTSAPVLLGQA